MQRFILLGASNLTFGFPLVVESLRESLPIPLELFAAHGHGRSYGHSSRVLSRRLPGIRECELWDTLAERPATTAQPYGLITDVGNDLLYGSDPARVLAWVEECLERLREIGAVVTITGLPVASVLRMSGPRYHATRMLFFPGGGPDWPTMRRMIGELDAGLRELAARYKGVHIEPQLEWYGVDPIHVRRRHRAEAWRAVLSAWPIDNLTISRPPLRRAAMYWRLRPARRILNGREQMAPQPVLTDKERMSVWLY